MKKFLVRLCNAAIIVAVLLGYNYMASAHEAQDALAKAEADALNAEVAAAWAGLQSQGDTADEDGTDGADGRSDAYADGIYQGTALGFGGDITVEVTVSDGRIADIVIISAKGEDGAYLSMAEDVMADILNAQSTDVDAISGATYSSMGIRDAVDDALEAAR